MDGHWKAKFDGHLKNRKKKARRWVVEACHGWFNRFRKLLVRYESWSTPDGTQPSRGRHIITRCAGSPCYPLIFYG